MKGQILSWTNAMLGLWLAIAPFAVGYSSIHGAVIEDALLGSGIAAFAFWRAVGGERPGMRAVSWIVATAGLWVAMAPVALGYSMSGAALANEVTVGLLIAVLGTARALAPVPARVV
ncbi:MAG TPA: SPW repeat protein [Vicinamibacterales bacterium]|nr:SPW repeat protein [Vicinamibacterales bacterium]